MGWAKRSGTGSDSTVVTLQLPGIYSGIMLEQTHPLLRTTPLYLTNAIQRQLDRLERWVHVKIIKFNKGKIPHKDQVALRTNKAGQRVD